MKKVFIGLFLLIIAIPAFSQYIRDNGESIEITTDLGTRTYIKSGVKMVVPFGNLLYLVDGFAFDAGVARKLVGLDYNDYGFASIAAFRSYIEDMVDSNYKTIFNAATDPDTAFNVYLTDTISYYLLIKNPNDSLLGSGPVIPW